MAPAGQPPCDEVGGVLMVVVAGLTGVRDLRDHLCPDKGTEEVALGSRIGGVLLLVTEVEKGSVAIYDVIGEPCVGGEAAEGVQANCGVVARIQAVWGVRMLPVGAD